MRADESWVPPARFELLESLGQGAMGRTYKAWDTQLRRHVVLKRPSPEILLDKDRLARFEDEARSLAQINQRNIIHVYELGRDSGDEPFLVTEFVEGVTLDKILARSRGLPSMSQRLIWLVQLADAIRAAHANGLIHRDIKPENIVIGRTGDGASIVKLIDFGLAVGPSTQVKAGRTSQGWPAGTPAYLAPERLMGSGASVQSDQYAFGIVAYHVCTGKDPVYLLDDGAARGAIGQIRESLHTLTAVPHNLRLVVRRCLSPLPETRYASSDDFARAVREALDPESLRAVGMPDVTGVRLVLEKTAPDVALAHIASALEEVLRGPSSDQCVHLRVWGYSLRWIETLPSALTDAARSAAAKYRLLEVSVMVPTQSVLPWFNDPKADSNHGRIPTNLLVWEGLASRRYVRRVTIYRSQTIPDSLGLLIDGSYALVGSYHFQPREDGPEIQSPSALNRTILECARGADEGQFLIDAYMRRWMCREKECTVSGEVNVHYVE